MAIFRGPVGGTELAEGECLQSKDSVCSYYGISHAQQCLPGTQEVSGGRTIRTEKQQERTMLAVCSNLQFLRLQLLLSLGSIRFVS